MVCRDVQWDPSGQSKPCPKDSLVCFGGCALQDHFESPLAENNICVVECMMSHMDSLFPVPSLQHCTDLGGCRTGVLNEFIQYFEEQIFLHQCFVGALFFYKICKCI